MEGSRDDDSRGPSLAEAAFRRSLAVRVRTRGVASQPHSHERRLSLSGGKAYQDKSEVFIPTPSYRLGVPDVRPQPEARRRQVHP